MFEVLGEILRLNGAMQLNWLGGQEWAVLQVTSMEAG